LAHEISRQDRGGVELEDSGPEQPLLIQRGVLPVERQQVVQVECCLRPAQQRAVGPAGGEVGVLPGGVGGDLVEEDVHADRGQARWASGRRVVMIAPPTPDPGSAPAIVCCSVAVTVAMARWLLTVASRGVGR
jgi:hypothetical protein